MGTIESHLQVINNTNQNIVNTKVYSCDNYDWDKDCRPDRNFQGQRIPSRGGSVSQRAEVNRNASHCPFNMILTFADDTVDEFRIHQKHAIGCCAGFNHMKRAHEITYHVVNDDNKPTLVIKIDNTSQQVQNEKAEEKNREGKIALEAKEYETALKKFSEGLGLANQDSTINNIKSNKSRAYNEFGKVCWLKAWDLEADITVDSYKEVQDLFDKALHLFQDAQTVWCSSEYQQNLILVTLKIEGNRIFSEANQLWKQGFELFQNGSSDNAAARSKYQESLLKFYEAYKKFGEGAKIDQEKFDDCTNIARGHIDEINKMIDDIDKLDNDSAEVEIDGKEKKREYEDRIDPILIQNLSVPSTKT